MAISNNSNPNKARLSMDLGELEKMAKHSKNKSVLYAMAYDHFNNNIICGYIASNCYSGSDTLDLLSGHPDPQIRLKVAKRGANITNPKTLVKLALDRFHPVRVALSKSTTDDGIKRLLLKGNLNDRTIVGNCLRRSSDMELIINFILQSSEERIKAYVSDILMNQSLTEIALKTLLITCSKMSNSTLAEIRDYANSSGFDPIAPHVIQYIDTYFGNYIDSNKSDE